MVTAPYSVTYTTGLECFRADDNPEVIHVVRHAEATENLSMESKKTVIVTGASQGIGKAVVQTFLDRGYNVVATSRSVSEAGFTSSSRLALVDGDISQAETAEKVAQAAVEKFGSIDHVVNNAGIFSAKPFTEYTIEEFRSFVSVNLEGFIFITQVQSGRCLFRVRRERDKYYCVARREPHRGRSGVDSDDHKGRTECDYPQPRERICEGQIRFNAVAPGTVDTPLHRGASKDALETRTPMGTISDPKDIAQAVDLSDGSSSRNRGGAARGRRCARGPMVSAKGSQPDGAERRLQELGIQLPAAPTPLWHIR